MAVILLINETLKYFKLCFIEHSTGNLLYLKTLAQVQNELNLRHFKFWWFTKTIFFRAGQQNCHALVDELWLVYAWGLEDHWSSPYICPPELHFLLYHCFPVKMIPFRFLICYYYSKILLFLVKHNRILKQLKG